MTWKTDTGFRLLANPTRMASRNGPDLGCAHWFFMVNNFASSSSMVQFASAAFVAGVGVKASVAVLECADELTAVLLSLKRMVNFQLTTPLFWNAIENNRVLQ
jgi:hypothetical protein